MPSFRLSCSAAKPKDKENRIQPPRAKTGILVSVCQFMAFLLIWRNKTSFVVRAQYKLPMIDKERLAHINGALLFLSMSMGVQPYDYLFRAEVFELGKNNIIESYASFVEDRRSIFGKIPGDDYNYSYFCKISSRVLTKYIRNAFAGRVGNEYQVAWKITDEIDCLFDWEMPDEIYSCDVRRRLCNQQGNIFFIPAGREFLVLEWLCKGGLLDQAA